MTGANSMGSKIAVIGGTGLYSMMDEFEMTRQEIVNTPYGEPSGPLVHGLLQGREVLFIARHGFTHRIPPHQINYQANIWMLKKAGVDTILAVNAVGGIHPGCGPESLVIPDQIIDYSWGREHTFYSRDLSKVVHIDFTYPYTESLRKSLLEAGKNIGLSMLDKAVYGCTQGPRLETAAEIRRLAQDGCDIVGMTGMPEAALAREMSLDYASIAVVANWAAGLSDDDLTMKQIQATLQQGMKSVKSLILEAVTLIN
jgi:5'-deoxy-5'-methylthioadenosine phosphorylase